MNVVCSTCRVQFDDAERTTICPHGRFLSPELQAQKDLALSLFGKSLRWAHLKTDEVLSVQSVGWDGMVTVRGYTGEFAPSLFVVEH